ncbi:cytochrome c oxidase subunit VIa [Colletotrichum fioriniae PJ7]|uniref:Cytochrome c oxidase subunit VIa n=1 Tax=Colletotrichum fioriniae PJ7 TaxID=1445577 RepID=A0A010RWS3_9PEZI|nr:cytochrome c oxidase subunit VIa [Colletotrichum fioriniae PJ7]
MQRQLLSAAARAARAPAVRSTVQRRFASTTENAFIKEREAAKHHAAETTGSSSPALPLAQDLHLVCTPPLLQSSVEVSSSTKSVVPRDICPAILVNAAILSITKKPEKSAGFDSGTAGETWETDIKSANANPKVFTFHSACIPALGLAAANAYVLWNEHWDHWSHMPPLEERVEYSYQNIRTKNYQWGNGDKTIFWNDNVNYHNPDKA